MDYVRISGAQRRAFRQSKHFRHAPLAAFAVAVGALAMLTTALENIKLGMALIGLYVVVALVLRIGSTATFRAAYVCLLFVPAITILRGPDSDLVESFAVYTFLLLLVGVASILAEQAWHAPWMFRFRKAPQKLEKSLDK